MEGAEEEDNSPGSATTATYEEKNDVPLYPALEDRSEDQNDNLKVNSLETSAPQPLTPSLPGFNFWDVNSYKRTVKRIDDGAKLCDDLLKLLTERAEIEGLYASKLQGWSKKWNDLISKGTEYGSVKNAWISLTGEADQLVGIHAELQSKLINQVHGNVQAWKSANYHKSLLSWKETKTAEEGFSKAQKPWAKRQDEVMKCKQAYYKAYKARDQAERLYKEASVEGSTVTEEQVKKLKDKADKASFDVQTTKDKYQESIRDITNYNPKYTDDMLYVFSKCQESEEKRKNFFKESYLNYCQQMELSQYYERMSAIHRNLRSSLEAADVSADISWWATNFGSEMPTKLIEFEEYSPGQEIQQTGGTTIPSAPPLSPGSTPRESHGSPNTKKSAVCATL